LETSCLFNLGQYVAALAQKCLLAEKTVPLQKIIANHSDKSLNRWHTTL